MTIERIARQLIVHGRVQGVFFRVFVREAALRFGVTGWASNEADGTVAVRLEGERGAVAQVERACGEGPPWASVARIDAHDAPVLGLAGFGVR